MHPYKPLWATKYCGTRPNHGVPSIATGQRVTAENSHQHSILSIHAAVPARGRINGNTCPGALHALHVRRYGVRHTNTRQHIGGGIGRSRATIASQASVSEMQGSGDPTQDLQVWTWPARAFFFRFRDRTTEVLNRGNES